MPPHLRLRRLHHPASPRHQHLLRASLQQSHRRRIVRFHVEVARPQRPPFAPPLDPVTIVQRLVARVLEPTPAPPAAGSAPATPPPAPIASSATVTVAPTPTPSPITASAATAVTAAASSRRAAAAAPTPTAFGGQEMEGARNSEKTDKRWKQKKDRHRGEGVSDG